MSGCDEYLLRLYDPNPYPEQKPNANLEIYKSFLCLGVINNQQPLRLNPETEPRRPNDPSPNPETEIQRYKSTFMTLILIQKQKIQ